MTGGLGDRGVFVTGTDTGVGKTVVSAALCQAWVAAGSGVSYLKPAQSGVDDGDDDARDVDRWTHGVHVATGVSLGASLAPSVAGRLARRSISGGELADFVAAQAAATPSHRLVVEGAGGLLVELGTDGSTCADLAAALQMAVVVVARPGLGTLNHTALTLAELDRRGLRLAGVVVSGWPARPDLATRTNLAELHRLSSGRLHGVVPSVPAIGTGAAGGALTRVDPSRWFTPSLGGRATIDELLALAD